MEPAVRYKSMSLIARQKISIVLDRVRAASRGRADVGLRPKNEASLHAYSMQELNTRDAVQAPYPTRTR